MTYVLLHGFTGGPASWDSVALPSGARVIRPWLAGHGPSPARPASWGDELERLAALLEAEAVEGAHLVGYSLGGRVGYHLLQRCPERFARATLIGAHPGLDDDEARRARREADARWIRLLREDGLEAFLAEWERLPLWASQARLPAERLAAQRAQREAHAADGLAHALEVLGLAEMPPVAPDALRLPVRLVVGAEDDKHRALSGALASRLPSVRLTVIEGAGHNVVLERPERLAALLTETS